MRAILASLLLLSSCSADPAFAFNQDGRYDAVPDHIKKWFKDQRSPHGVPCCDIADGHPVQEDIRGDAYWVFFEGEWRQVPKEAVIDGAKNPNGEAIVWYVKQGENVYYIRCFVPGSGF